MFDTGKSLDQEQGGKERTKGYQADRWKLPEDPGELYPYWHASAAGGAGGGPGSCPGTYLTQTNLCPGN